MGAGIMSAIAVVLLFLLTLGTNNRVIYERNFSWLVVVNVLVAAILLAVLVWGGVRLLVRLRKGRFGSRLLLKLAAIFALVGVVPGLLIYVVSYQFVSRSIETWFDVEVEGALNAGVNLARVTLETLASDMAANTRSASSQLSQVPDAGAGLVLERMRDQLGASDLVLWSAVGQPLASAGQSLLKLNPTRPSAQMLQQARQQRGAWQIEGLEDAIDAHATLHARVRVLVPVVNPRGGLLEESRYLETVTDLPPALVSNAVAVQQANREYQERALARVGLRRMYIGTLTLSLFLAVFGAVLLAMILGNQLARPLLVLADGVREVAAGNLTPKAALESHDELGQLTRAFALMTQQLADARAQANHSMQALDSARAPADHHGQPHRGRDRARPRRLHPHLQPGRHAHPSGASCRVAGQAAGRGSRAGRFRSRGAAAVRAVPGQCRPPRPGSLATRLRAAWRRQCSGRHGVAGHQHRGTRRRAARQRAAAGV